MKAGSLKLITFTFVLSMIISCSDDPTDLGIGLIPQQDKLRNYSLTIQATSDTTFLYRIKGISSSLTGFYRDNYSDSTLESRALIQFRGFTAIPKTADSLSAVIKIPINYMFKKSSGNLKLSVHEISQPWDEKTFTWDNCAINGFYNSNIETTFVRSNIDSAELVLAIDVTPIVRRWVIAGTDVPNGIILIPVTDTLYSNIIVGTRNSIDTMVVTYRDTGTTLKTLSVIATQQTFVANGSIPQIDTVSFIQAGVGYRNLMRFDISSIPRRASITQAIFEVTSDEISSLRNSYSHDSLIVYLARNDTFPYTSITLGTICSKSSDASHLFYSADIKTIVQQWVVHEPNYGLILSSYGELISFDRFAIFSASSQDLSCRPKLKIKYTVLP